MKSHQKNAITWQSGKAFKTNLYTAEDNESDIYNQLKMSSKGHKSRIEFPINTLLVALTLLEDLWMTNSRLNLMSIHYTLWWHTAFEILSREITDDAASCHFRIVKMCEVTKP